MFEKRIVVDCRGHLLGRLASVIAKEILGGQHIVCVRTEEINVSGSFYRNKLKYLAFVNKRCNVNPKRGPFHFRAPSKILWRTVRGMLPHKTKRGAEALKRLKVYEGVPPAYATRKRLVVPEALKVTRLRPGRKFTVLHKISTNFGWKYADIIKKLETKRKHKANAYYSRKVVESNLKKNAVVKAGDSLKQVSASLANYGY
eukprot:TRINITY_DN767_c0_g1_i1.p1 TRINITY_DN767_c0_g1~~TRINITY_DN767_c0_g1_i1.p1  ORF type:complete len:201 (+),score=71.30 TRINITY_DN767_c0_g1_i1:115-717(+)